MENNICNQIAIYECVAANEINQRIYGVFQNLSDKQLLLWSCYNF